MKSINFSLQHQVSKTVKLYLLRVKKLLGRMSAEEGTCPALNAVCEYFPLHK